MAAVAIRDTSNQGAVLSLVLHAAVILVAWKGLPFLNRPVSLETPPLIVDLVPISEITSAAPPPTPEPAPEPAPQPQPEPPKPVQAEAPTADAMPPSPKEQVPEKKAEKPPEPVVKPIPKPEPPKKNKKDDMAALQDLLKDMQKKAPKPQNSSAKSEQPSNNIAPNISDRASMTELDAIRRHIEACWRIDPGKEGLENMSADIKVFINPDGSATAQIVDMARYFADTAFRTFANSARNAVLGCGNIPVSPERYSLFKEITMTFSPQGRIN